MFLEQRVNVFDPPPFNLATTGILGTTQRWPIDRTWPIEEIWIRVCVDVTTAFGQTANTITTPAARDGLAGIISKINLSINDGRQPRSVVDVSGIGLLEYISQVGMNLDRNTLKAIQTSTLTSATAAVATGSYEITYRVPMCSPQIGEPLRSRMYLPVHTHPQDPVLSLSFNTIAGMGYNAAGAIAGTAGQAVRVNVLLLRRLPTLNSEALIRSTSGSNPNGYIDFDLIETNFTPTLSSAQEFRMPVPVPGNYLNQCWRFYRGNSVASGSSGANVFRAPIDGDATNTGGSTEKLFGIEPIWRLETGLQVIRNWRWQNIRAINDCTRVLDNIADNATSGNSAAPDYIPASTLVLPGSALLDFLSDGVTGDTGNELGSVLDCNTPGNNGLKMEVIGTPSNVTVNPHQVFCVGHRLFGDISKWQKF